MPGEKEGNNNNRTWKEILVENLHSVDLQLLVNKILLFTLTVILLVLVWSLFTYAALSHWFPNINETDIDLENFRLKFKALHAKGDCGTLSLRLKHKDENRQLQQEFDLQNSKKVLSLRDLHEAQLRFVRLKHEDECRQLQQGWDLEKYKEERQSNVMSDRPQEEQGVNSLKDNSFTEGTREPGGLLKVKQSLFVSKDLPFRAAVQAPVSSLLPKVAESNPEDIVEISMHGGKAAHLEYDQEETTNGGTVTKRRKTQSSLMFADPRNSEKVKAPRINTQRSSTKV